MTDCSNCGKTLNETDRYPIGFDENDELKYIFCCIKCKAEFENS